MNPLCGPLLSGRQWECLHSTILLHDIAFCRTNSKSHGEPLKGSLRLDVVGFLISSTYIYPFLY